MGSGGHIARLDGLARLLGRPTEMAVDDGKRNKRKALGRAGREVVDHKRHSAREPAVGDDGHVVGAFFGFVAEVEEDHIARLPLVQILGGCAGGQLQGVAAKPDRQMTAAAMVEARIGVAFALVVRGVKAGIGQPEPRTKLADC